MKRKLDIKFPKKKRSVRPPERRPHIEVIEPRDKPISENEYWAKAAARAKKDVPDQWK